MEDPVGRWFLEIVFLVFCAVLACAQAALTNANESKLLALDKEKGKKLLPLLERSEPVLALRGLRTLFLLLFAAVGSKMIQGWGLRFIWSAGIFCLVAAPAVMVLCKMVPEKVGQKRAEKTAIALRTVILGTNWLMTPFTAVERLAARGIVRLFGIDPHAKDEVTEEDIQAMMDIGEESGVIESDEREMIKNVFEFGDLTAADCMTHRTDVTALWVDDDEETIRSTIKESGLSRFPVYNEDIDDIVGILSTREYLLNAGEKDPKPLRKLLRDPYFVTETVPTDVLLRNMQLAKTHMAIVVDEYGGMSGLVTMEDLLEEIVGNIYDEFDPTAESEIEPLGENSWRVSGTMDLDTLEETIGVTLPRDEDYDTLGGLIFSRFSTIPEDGSTPSLTLYATADGEKPEDGEADQVRLDVERIEDRRVEWARVTVIHPRDPEAPGERKD